MAMVGRSEAGGGESSKARGSEAGVRSWAGARKLHRGRAVSATPVTDGEGQHQEDWLPVLRGSLYSGHCSSAQQQPGLAFPKGRAKQDQV